MRAASRILSSFLAFAPAGMAWAAGLNRNELLVGDDASQVAPKNIDETTFISAGERYLIGIVAMVAVGAFVWIGYNMLTAEGDPDKFKQAQKALSYAVMGLAIIPLAYTIVKLVVSINF